MQAQAQFTIHSLNDVVASTTAPSSPYKGQLWVDTSYSPPRTFVYNGSAWKEQNGTDTLRTNISTLTTKSNTMRSDLDGLTSTVSAVTTRVETVEDDLGVIEETVLDVQTSVTELEQTATSIALRVTTNETNISSLTVSHNSLAARVTTAEGNITSLIADVSGLKTRVSNAEGDISSLEQTATSLTTRVTNAEGDITSLEQTATSLTTRITSAEGNITTLTTSVNGLKTRVTNAEGDISTLEQSVDTLSATVESKADESGGSSSSFGWSLTSSGFYLYSNGDTVMSVTSSGLSVDGEINATSGTLSELTVTGRLYFGGDQSYFIDPNYDDGSYYIYLPGFRVDDASGAVFSGRLSAPSGSIGGFTISTSAIYKTKTAYSNSTAGVYIGTDGIGLGAGKFYVTSAGALTCTSGAIGGFTIGSSSIYKTKTAYSNSTAGVYLGTDGIGLGAGTFYVTSAGALTATSATITGTINATGGTFTNMTITGTIYFNEDQSYFLNPNLNNGSWYIYLPKFRVDDTSAYFSGTLQAPGGNIGGFTIGSTSIYKTKTSYNSSADGVYIGTDGIGLGKGTFYVTSDGALYATSATITGTFSNKKSSGLGLEISGSTVSFYNGSTKIGHLTGGTGYIPWNNSSSTVSGIAVSSLLCADGGVRVGKSLQLSTGNGIYVSNKLALTMGQVKVQTNTAVQRYLLFYCGLLVGIGSSKFDGISDYSASTYSG